MITEAIKVDDYLQTSASHVLAIGDVLDGYHFTHVAAYQGGGLPYATRLVPIAKKESGLSCSTLVYLYRPGGRPRGPYS